jgi:hypothetical protein
MMHNSNPKRASTGQYDIMKEYKHEYTARYCRLEGAQAVGKVEGNRNKLRAEGTSEAFRFARCSSKTAGTMNHGRNKPVKIRLKLVTTGTFPQNN